MNASSGSSSGFSAVGSSFLLSLLELEGFGARCVYGIL